MRNPLPSLSALHWIFLGVTAAVAIALVYRNATTTSVDEGKAPPSVPAIPAVDYSPTHYLNVASEARFIGSAACASCHRTNETSYRRTAHCRAFSDVDPANEPSGGSFHHAASGRDYRVYRQDGRLRHEEVMRTADGKEVTRQDFPVRYLVGSGHFSRTYLIEVDGFLHESPITWYASRQKWDLSPGYDTREHFGFERGVELRCLACHAGRVEEAGAVARLTFHEKAIGCESCHGPGSLHQAARTAAASVEGDIDWTIVHPGKAQRQIEESICASCHEGGVASIDLRGRRQGEFQPGRPLSDFRIHYGFAGDGSRMTVVGHVEQLRQSACYRKSERLTCVTCHDPHERNPVADRTAFNRGKCQSCHERKPCTLDEPKRRERGDDCVACHMPRGDTDVPHVAFTHHRIGLHGGSPPALGPGKVPELVSTDAEVRLSPLDRQRNLGLAYAEIYKDPRYARFADAFRRRARENLEAVHSAGLRDGDALAQLAELHVRDHETDLAMALAREVLDLRECSVGARALALMILADGERQRGDLLAAIGHFEEATRLRRSDDNWRMLGVTYLESGDAAKAFPALQQALSIRPYMPDTQYALAEIYRRQGKMQLANSHREKADWLMKMTR